jgi:hypothetical protein
LCAAADERAAATPWGRQLRLARSQPELPGNGCFPLLFAQALETSLECQREGKGPPVANG